MESDVESTLKIETYYPTIDEFKDFAEYIRRLEKQNISFAKVNLLHFTEMI